VLDRHRHFYARLRPESADAIPGASDRLKKIAAL
jgi:hypothetical protein